MIVCFSLGISIPTILAHRSIDRVSDMENRYYANPPKVLSEEGHLNTSFNADFDSWINDNLRFRSLIVSTNAKLQYYLFHRIVRDDYLVGKNGELYIKSAMEEYQRTNQYSAEDLNTFCEGLSNLNDILASQGTKLYYMQCFEKEDFNPQNYPDGINQGEGFTRAQQVANVVSTNTSVSLIPIYEPLASQMESKRLFFKTVDPGHWNEDGAFIGLESILTTLQTDFQNVPSVSIDDYEITPENSVSNIYGLQYPYPEESRFLTMKSTHAQKIDAQEAFPALYDSLNYKTHTSLYQNPDSDNQLRVLLMGDSFLRMFLVDDIAEHFSTVMNVDNSNVATLPFICEEYKPDIVILEGAAADGGVGIIYSGLQTYVK